MIFDAWRRKSVKRKLEAVAATPEAPSQIKGRKLTLVGLLADTTDFADLELMKQMIGSLGRGINYDVLCYSKSKRAGKNLHETKYYPSGFTFKGEVDNANIREFVAKPFDVLVSYHRSDNVFVKYVAALSNARVKVGFPTENVQVSPLAIDVDFTEYEAFANELKKYLKIFNCID